MLEFPLLLGISQNQGQCLISFCNYLSCYFSWNGLLAHLTQCSLAYVSHTTCGLCQAAFGFMFYAVVRLGGFVHHPHVSNKQTQ